MMRFHACGCHNPKLARVKREGLLDALLNGIFGRYPWKCRNCRNRVYLLDRGKKARKRSNHTEAMPSAPRAGRAPAHAPVRAHSPAVRA